MAAKKGNAAVFEEVQTLLTLLAGENATAYKKSGRLR